MNTAYLERKYATARAAYLDQVAYMDTQNESFAEKYGGVSALDAAQKQRYEGIKRRLIALAAFDDVAAEYVQSLENDLDEALVEIRRLKARVTELTGGEPFMSRRDYLQLMLLPNRVPTPLSAYLTHKEGRRQAIKNAVTENMPHLFQPFLPPPAQ